MKIVEQDVSPYMTIPPYNIDGRNPLLSFIVPTVDRKNEFLRFIDSLLNQTAELSQIELIIVDQNKDDRIFEIINSLYNINIIYFRIEKIGLSYAKNQALSKINGLFCSYLDDDCWLDKNTLNILLSQLQLLKPFEGLLMNAMTPEGKFLVPGKLRAGFILNEENLLEAFYAPQISQVYPTFVVKNLQGFNKNLGIGTRFGSAEDTDLLIRALKNKITFKYFETIKIIHPKIENKSCAFKKRYQYGLGFGALCRIHNFKFYFIIKLLRPAIGFILFLPLNWRKSFLYFFTLLGRLKGYSESFNLSKKIKDA